jgi:ammonium transporter Rh
VFQGFWHNAIIKSSFKEGMKIPLNMPAIINADFCAASILITMGGVLGKTTFSQLFVLVTIECIFYCLNAVIVLEKLKVLDIGGSITIHMFGAYFGLAATYFFENKKALKDEKGLNGGSYNSQLIAMVGTVFLFMYWPSFNGALAVGMA